MKLLYTILFFLFAQNISIAQTITLSNPSVFPSPHAHASSPAAAPAAAGHGLRARNTTRMRASGGALVRNNEGEDGSGMSSARLQQQVRSSSS